MMKKLLTSIAAFIAFASFNFAASAESEGTIYSPENMRIRDPFVFADKNTGYYYIQASDNHKGLKVYRSKNLKEWEFVGKSFVPQADFWGFTDFWAPDMFYRDGKYYVIATFSERNKSVKTQRGIEPLRACSVLVSDKPEGPYKPLVNAPLTPKNWMALDGTLFEDTKTGKLWLIYCHEWLQVDDGEIIAQEISKDLTKTIGEPILLFKASAAKWGVPRVTDAPVINIADDGTMYMTWSTFGKDGKYHIAYATSPSGNPLGPWIHADKPINTVCGGHAMVFKTFDGKLMISYHSPNSGAPERPTIRPFSVGKDGASIDEK